MVSSNIESHFLQVLIYLVLRCTDALAIAELAQDLGYRVDGLCYIPYQEREDGRLVPQAYIVTSPNMSIIYNFARDTARVCLRIMLSRLKF